MGSILLLLLLGGSSLALATAGCGLWQPPTPPTPERPVHIKCVAQPVLPYSVLVIMSYFFCFQMPRCTQALSAMFLLFPGKHVASASRKRGGARSRSDDVIVGILVCALLLLLLLLFLAWRHLSHTSEGKYHPRRLMRVVLFRLQELWEQTRNEELSQGSPDEQSDEELGKPQEEEDDAGGEEEEDGEQQQQQREEPLPQQAGHQPEEERQGRLTGSAELEPTEQEAAREPSKEDEPSSSRAVEGKAGALLCNRPSFSGTAAWEDSGQQAQATVL